MSTTTLARPYRQALQDANDLRDLFDSHAFEQWHFAGSLRRRRPTVGDIEHVIVPRFGDVLEEGQLFARATRVNLVWRRLEGLLGQRVVLQHLYKAANGAVTPRWGELYRGVDFRGTCHEFFLATPDNLGAILAIRTGPRELSTQLVQRLRRRGYIQEGGQVWRDGTAIPVRTEREYFALADVPYLEPERR